MRISGFQLLIYGSTIWGGDAWCMMWCVCLVAVGLVRLLGHFSEIKLQVKAKWVLCSRTAVYLII